MIQICTHLVRYQIQVHFNCRRTDSRIRREPRLQETTVNQTLYSFILSIGPLNTFIIKCSQHLYIIYVTIMTLWYALNIFCLFGTSFTPPYGRTSRMRDSLLLRKPGCAGDRGFAPIHRHTDTQTAVANILSNFFSKFSQSNKQGWIHNIRRTTLANVNIAQFYITMHHL